MKEERIFQGVSLSEGIAIGSPYYLLEKKNRFQELALVQSDVESEIQKYRSAIKQSYQDLSCLQNVFRQDGCGVVVDIFDSHLEILKDPFMTVMMEDRIREEKKSSESIFRTTIDEYKKRFKNLKDPFFQDRLRDVVDVSHRVMRHLCQLDKVDLSTIPPSSIVFSSELIPSDIAEVKASIVGGFVTRQGGHASHAAIIARARGIPYVTRIDVSLFKRLDVEKIIVDGTKGLVIVNPSEATLQEYVKKKQGEIPIQKDTKKLCSKDGVPLSIYGNVETWEDVDILQKYPAAGVGLFRSEIFFAMEKSLPTEEVQVRVYTEISRRLYPMPVVIRLFDVNGEKNFWEDEWDEDFYEMNPSLGCRGVRFLLRRPPLLEEQLRAITRANVLGNLKILIPMVSDVFEIKQVRSILASLPQGDKLPLGCMIEVPSAAIMSDVFAKQVDFLAIGTNDLTQYVLAADRSSPYMNYLYEGLHPSLLSLLKTVAEKCQKVKKPFCICGELAANPLYTQLLLGIGVREMSVAPRHMPHLMHTMRQIDISASIPLVKRALEMESSLQIKELLEQFYKDGCLDFNTGR